MAVFISLFILLFITSAIVLSSLVLFFHISLTPIILLFAFVTALIAIRKVTSITKKQLIIVSIVTVVVLIFGVSFANLTVDNTWDGSAYHKNAVGFLKEGWNPYYEKPEEFLEKSDLQNADLSPLTWAEVYPKGTWYFASLIYLLTGSIESGEVYTILFSVILGLHLYSYLKKIGIKNRDAVLIGFVGGLNPIVLAQFQTYYLDGVVGCVIIGLNLCFLEWLSDSDENNHSRETMVQVACYIIWACNLKFSAILFAATSCLVFLCCQWVFQRKLSLYDICYLGGTGIGSCIAIGWSPYMTNILRYKNLFYGFSGLFSEELFDVEFGIAGLGTAGRFFVSLLARTSHGNYHTLKDTLKVPFTFKWEELYYYAIPDARLGGFGIFFSGLFLCSLVCLVIKLCYEVKSKKLNPCTWFIFCLVVVNFIEMANLLGTHTARYIPHFWGMVIYFLTVLSQKKRTLDQRRIYKLAFVLFSGLTIANALPWVSVSFERIRSGLLAQESFNELKEKSEEGAIYYVTFYSNAFNGIQYDLIDNNINYKYVVQNVNELTDYQILSGFNWIYYKQAQGE